MHDDEAIGETLAAVSKTLVGLLREHYGRGPSRAKTYAVDDCVFCVLRDGFTPFERTLVDGGRAERVVELRQEFQALMQGPMCEAIEAITERNVVAFLSQAHVEPDITVEMFFLDRPLRGLPAELSSGD